MRLGAGLAYADVFSIVIFHVDTISRLYLLPAGQSLCELRLVAREGLGAGTLLVRVQVALT